jgi:hypothetical protein
MIEFIRVSIGLTDDNEVITFYEPRNIQVAEDRLFTFGKYKGHEISTVLAVDPQYCLWAHNTVSFFQLTEEELKLTRESTRKPENQPRRRRRRYGPNDQDAYDNNFPIGSDGWINTINE